MTKRARIPWPLLKRIGTWILLAAVIVLVIVQARKVAWLEVMGIVRAYSLVTLSAAVLCTALTYTVYSCFDLLGRSYVGATLRTRDVMATAFVSYACNQNFGALLGTVGLRLKLYITLGIGIQDVSRIILLSIVTNWLGYIALAGGLLTCRLITLPNTWGAGEDALQLVGVFMLMLVAAYLWLCAHSKRRHVHFRSIRFDLPSISLAAAQLLLSISHWPLTATIIYVLLDYKVDFVTVLGTFMLTSVAIVVAHLPGGIGVLEGMFLIMLGRRIPPSQLLAALLVFRAFFYIGAVAVAGVIYLSMEANLKSLFARRSLFRHKSP